MDNHESKGTVEERLSVLEYQMNGNGDPGVCANVKFIYDYVVVQKGKEAGIASANKVAQSDDIERRLIFSNRIAFWGIIFLALSTMSAIFSGYVAYRESAKKLGTQNIPAVVSSNHTQQDAGSTLAVHY